MKLNFKKITLVCALMSSTVALNATSAHAAGEAKNVIFFLGDGMGPTTVTAARIYKYGEAGKLTMETLPRTARIKTYSLDAQTTDSAPSMAAYMTGIKTRNEVLGMDGNTFAAQYAPGTDANGVSAGVNKCPATGNGAPAATILELAIAKGKATGVVTTARLTHATPGATYAHVCHRNAEYEIARQAVPGGEGYNSKLGAGIDVMMGGISYYWTPFPSPIVTSKRGRNDGRDLTKEMQAKGYTFVNDKTSLLAASANAGTKILGLFDFAATQGHMSYDLDRDASKEPSLAEMTSKAIDILSKNTNGYFLMVEGGRIDHALHETNAGRALAETIAFDDAIKIALGKVDLANTLVIVTADHDHTLAFNGYASKGNPILGKTDSVQRPGVPTLAADGKPYTTLVFGNGTGNGNISTSGGGSTRSVTRDDLTNIDTTNKNYYQQYGVQLTGSGAGGETHGSGDVMLFANGAGRAPFKGTLDNTKVFELLKTAFGF